MSKGLTQREAAALLTVSQPRIAKLVKEGRISKLEDGSLDPASVQDCGRVLAGRSGGGRPAGTKRETPKANNDNAYNGYQAASAVMTAEWADLTHSEAVRIRECARAWRETMSAQKEAGTLVEVDVAAAEYEKIAGAVRERFMGLPSRAATRLGLDVEQRSVLSGLVREALMELSTA